MTPEADARPLFLCEADQFGGAERSLLALSRRLHDRGLPNYLLVYKNRCDLASYATHPLQVVELRPGIGGRRKVAALRAYLASRPASAPHPLVSGYQPALHATIAGVRGFHTLMHDTPALFGDSARRRLPARLRTAVTNRIVGFGLRSGGVTLVNSEFLRDDCRREFNMEAMIARMGGLSGMPAAPQPKPPVAVGGALNLLSICRIEANKRIDWILRALAELERDAAGPLAAPLSHLVDWRLDLAGKGALIEELQRLSETLGLAARVHFHGFVPDQQLETMYANAHLFLMPAVQGYGIPAIEALQRGIPVLLHRDSGVSDILLDTPWATVLHGGESRLAPALAEAIHGVMGRDLRAVPLPQLPSEEEWADQIIALCRWA